MTRTTLTPAQLARALRNGAQATEQPQERTRKARQPKQPRERTVRAEDSVGAVVGAVGGELHRFVWHKLDNDGAGLWEAPCSLSQHGKPKEPDGTEGNCSKCFKEADNG